MSAVAALEQLLDRSVRAALAPPPKWTVSEWAEQRRMVSSYSAEPGPWRNSRTPYLVEIMDCFSDPLVNTVAFMKCARIGGSEAGLNIVGYFIDQDPSPVLIIQPTVDDAKDYSKEQIASMIADTPCLAAKVHTPRAKETGNTIQAKVFEGGSLALVGANSPRGFRRRTSRVVIFEEVDGYPPSAGTEGDQIKLGMRRSATFSYRAKHYLNSTPTLEGASRIADYYARSDQRQYHVPCPHCETRQPLSWTHLKWERDQEPQYACTACGSLIAEEHKLWMNARGRWVARVPGRAIRGYHLNALYSPWVTWAQLRDEFVEATESGDPRKLQVFINTALGEPWVDRAGTLSTDSLLSRVEIYATEVPAGVQVLTGGVDVQGNRLELIVRGFAVPSMESWRIGRWIFEGDPTGEQVWKDLDEFLKRSFQHEAGGTMRLYAVGIDSGHEAQSVYKFCKKRVGRRLYALKGSSKPGAPIKPERPSRKKPVFSIGTDAAKDEIYGRLRITKAAEEPSKAGYMHFDEDADVEYFDQLTSERKRPKERGGMPHMRYERLPGRAAESLDCEVYLLAAFYLSGADRRARDGSRLLHAPGPPPPGEAPPTAPADPTLPPDPDPVLPRPRRRPRGWMSGFLS